MVRRYTKRNIVLMAAVAVAVAAVLVASRQEGVLAGSASVIDGATLRVAGQKVRLQGLAAPELHELGGREAKNALMELVGGQRVTCELDGTISADHVVGHCFAGGQDLAAELVVRGLARDCARSSGGRYRDLETEPAKSRPLPADCTP